MAMTDMAKEVYTGGLTAQVRWLVLRVDGQPDAKYAFIKLTKLTLAMAAVEIAQAVHEISWWYQIRPDDRTRRTDSPKST